MIGQIQMVLLSDPMMGAEIRMEGRTGMVRLLEGDVREAPTIERSFLAGESECIFEPSIGALRTSRITVWRYVCCLMCLAFRGLVLL